MGTDRDLQGLRLRPDLFVAATRARELLVVPTIGDGPRQSLGFRRGLVG